MFVVRYLMLSVSYIESESSLNKKKSMIEMGKSVRYDLGQLKAIGRDLSILKYLEKIGILLPGCIMRCVQWNFLLKCYWLKKALVSADNSNKLNEYFY